MVVAGLREGSLLRVEGERISLLGPSPVRVFRAAFPPNDVRPGDVTAALG
jgi:dipeptidase E